MTPSAPDRVEPAAPILGEVVVRLGDHVVDVQHVGQRPVSRDRYVIGEGPGVDLPVALPAALPAGLDRAGVPLLIALERQLVLGLVPGMSGSIRDGEQIVALAGLVAQGRRSYALPPGARCEAEIGPLRFVIQAVEPVAFEPARRPVDRLYWASNLGALALIGGAIWIAEPPVTTGLELEELALHRARAVQLLSDTPPRPPAPPPVLPRAHPPVARSRPETASARPAVAPAPQPELAAVVADDAPPIAPKGMRRGIRRDNDHARYAMLADEGIDEVLGVGIADTQESLLAFRDSAEDRKMWNDVLAAPVISRPFGGLELAETERGGGVHDERRRPAKGPGKTLTIDGSAAPRGPSAEERALARRVFKIDLEMPYVRGAMNPQTVLEHVRKQQEGLRRCFRDAVGTSDRVGTVIFRLQVNGSGRVSAASLDFGGEKLGDIGPCIRATARTWRFPAPTDERPATVIVEAVFSARSY